jgi:vitamin B12 transporter
VVDCTYFRNDFTNLIEWVGPWPGSYENVAKAFTSGVELTARLELDPCTTMYGTYTHTLARDLITGELLRRRPPHKASFGVNRRLCYDRANVNLNLLYVGPREQMDWALWPAPRVTVSEYYLLNLAGSYDVNSWCQVFARIDNLLDYDYQEVLHYATAPISAYAGVSIRL